MPTHPNIVFITCHDLGRHIGCYGVPSVHTPTLNAAAADGIRFANSFCTSPGCSPSRAAIATGRYPHSNGVLGLAHAHFGWQLAPTERHIAKLLGEGGYHTVLCGLQHVTYDVSSLGFAQISPQRPADEVAANAEAFLEKWPGDRRFYLEINFFEPHRPFDYGGVQPDTERGVHVPTYLPNNDAARGELASMQGAIRKMDAAVERIQEAARRAGLLDDTLLVFTADHGIAFPRAKGTFYDPGIETALLLRWPNGGLTGGQAPAELISNIDLAPTLLEIAGIEPPAVMQGRSFLPLLAGDDYSPRNAIFAEKTFHNEYDPLRCIRTDRYKLIARLEVANAVEVPADILHGPTYATMIEATLRPRGSNFEMYDLHNDPNEQVNLAGSDEHASVEAELKRRLYGWMRDTEDPLLRGPVASPFYYRTITALAGSG